tara:strand:+ start:9223 stop:10017 length:795 start_codon:yes stop_codon:yes gene_type:complete
MQVTDHIGRVFQIDSTPKRIISLVPSQTELLYDLGLEDQVIGLTKFCVHPERAKQKTQIVGGTKNIKLEKIRDLKPDIILCNKEENTKEIVEICQEICPVHVSDIFTLDDTKKMIEDYGEIFNRRTEAEVITEKLTYKLNDFLSYIKNKPRLKVAYFIWRNPWMVAANNTFINHLLTLNKFENIYSNKERYPEVELGKIRLEGDPDLMLLSSEPYPFKEEHVFEIERFTDHAKTIFVDGELFSWYGTRLLHSFNYFKKLRERVE